MNCDFFPETPFDEKLRELTAKGANVPIIFNTFDFGKKEYLISDPYYLTDNMEKDFLFFHNFYKDVKGKHPDQYETNFHKNI